MYVDLPGSVLDGKRIANEREIECLYAFGRISGRNFIKNKEALEDAVSAAVAKVVPKIAKGAFRHNNAVMLAIKRAIIDTARRPAKRRLAVVESAFEAVCTVKEDHSARMEIVETSLDLRRFMKHKCNELDRKLMLALVRGDSLDEAAETVGICRPYASKRLKATYARWQEFNKHI